MQTIEDMAQELNNSFKDEVILAKQLDQKKQEYLIAREELASLIRTHRNKREQILNCKIPVSLSTYVEEVARLWETDVSNIDAQLLFYRIKGKLTKKQIVDTLSKRMYFLGWVRFVVKQKDNPSKQWFTLRQELNEEFFNAIQKDGKPFVEHLYPKVNCDNDGSIVSTLECDDYKHIVFNCEFKDIYTIISHPEFETNDIALLNTCIRDEKKIGVAGFSQEESE